MLNKLTGLEVLLSAVAELSSSKSLSDLQIAYQRLERDYRDPIAREPGKALQQSFDEQLAFCYLNVRMAPIYMILYSIFVELKHRADLVNLTISSMWHLGAGPGTALIAALATFDSLKSYDALERQIIFIDIAKTLIESVVKHPLYGGRELDLNWHKKDLCHFQGESEADLFVASYVLGELAQNDLIAVVQKIWNQTAKFLVIVEPGTPQGFQRIKSIREYLINNGANIVAPCGGSWSCQSNWFHFSERVARSTLHRKIKFGTLGYEDEHFSYLIASRFTFPVSGVRVVGRVRANKFQVEVPVCADKGELKQLIFSRKGHSKEYKESKKLKWGDFLSS
jgi:ribosomal protein RSM22 (predicted rRNA methylase)